AAMSQQEEEYETLVTTPPDSPPLPPAPTPNVTPSNLEAEDQIHFATWEQVNSIEVRFLVPLISAVALKINRLSAEVRKEAEKEKEKEKKEKKEHQLYIPPTVLLAPSPQLSHQPMTFMTLDVL